MLLLRYKEKNDLKKIIKLSEQNEQVIIQNHIFNRTFHLSVSLLWF